MRRVLAVLVALVVVATAQASVALRVGIDKLSAMSDAVVDGTIVDHATSLDAAQGAIWTSFRVRVGESLAGRVGGEIAVRVRGGRVGRLEQETLGSPKLHDGERAVFFLSAENDGAREIVALAQGVFHVEMRDGVAVCGNSLEGLSLVDRGGGSVEAEPLRLPLETLRAQVAAARERLEERRRAASEALDRRFARWRASAIRHAEMSRGRPGGAPN